ncbi:flagellum-specific ATP synthase FliI [Desulfovibrionales bacterium]
MSLKLQACLDILKNVEPCRSYSKVSKLVGLIVEGRGVRTPLGSACRLLSECGEIRAQNLAAEVVGFREDSVLFMPYGDLHGIRPGMLIENDATPSLFPMGSILLGRVVDAFGVPLDNLGPIVPSRYYPIFIKPISPLERPYISEPLDVGVRAINGLLTLGKGQRVGIIAGSSMGKSMLMGMIARYTKADINVLALVGERSCDVLKFMDKSLGPEGLSHSVLIVATADVSPLVRIRAAYAATAVAEYFRDQGMDVLLIIDSVTHFAMAVREVGLAAGEPSTINGYTPSVFTQLSKLLGRAGSSSRGTITGIYNVLVDGHDFNEPVASAVRSILDGHIVLTQEMADQGHYPCIDILKSISRLRTDVTPREVVAAGHAFIQHLVTYKRMEDIVNIGAYAHGFNPEIRKTLAMIGPIHEYLQQVVDKSSSLEESFEWVQRLMR